MQSENTGNYRLCRQQIGIGGTITVLSIFENEEKCKGSYNNANKETDWEYYCEQEVIYTGTQFDANGNPVDSSPAWIRLNC